MPRVLLKFTVFVLFFHFTKKNSTKSIHPTKTILQKAKYCSLFYFYFFQIFKQPSYKKQLEGKYRSFLFYFFKQVSTTQPSYKKKSSYKKNRWFGLLFIFLDIQATVLQKKLSYNCPTIVLLKIALKKPFYRSKGKFQFFYFFKQPPYKISILQKKLSTKCKSQIGLFYFSSRLVHPFYKKNCTTKNCPTSSIKGKGRYRPFFIFFKYS